MASTPRPHTRPVPKGHIFQLLDSLAFPWREAAKSGMSGWHAGNTVAERSFWRQADGKWLIVWRDGDDHQRTMALDGTFSANDVASKIARWHLNRAAMLRTDGQPIPGTARGGVNLLMGRRPGLIAQRCSALLHRPVPAEWTLADAVDAFPNDSSL